MAETIHDAQRLLELQALPLERKIQVTQTRIIEWHNHYHGNVCVSFSGGKDSTVLLHIARQIYPDIPAVFSNTGLEYPEIQRFVKSFDNVDIVTPKMRFDEVLSTYGYPLIGKEVAEAIYYARRLRSQTVNVEREREQPPESKQSYKESGNARQKDSQVPQKTYGEVTPMKQTTFKRLEMGGGQNERLIKTSTARNRRTVLTGRMPGAGVVNGGIGVEDALPRMNGTRETKNVSTTDGAG